MAGEAETDMNPTPALDKINEAADRYKSSGVYAMLSGGDDSLTCALITTQAKLFRACVHLDTGIGIPETREYVRELCRQQGWPLKIYRAADQGQHYVEHCRAYGFPGPGQHWRMYTRLKERPLRAFVREHKQHRLDRLLLSTGARSQESQRRMGHVQPERRDGVKVWLNPIHDWSKSDCHVYIASRGVARNPVVELLHMSGECLCGAFAKPGELKEIALWYPHVAAEIRNIEGELQALHPNAAVWGQRPKGSRATKRRDMPMCTNCLVGEQ